ncbi:MAG: NADP-dependent oxidoreductase [Friedmanniella sp.]|jgi:NADPH:quinone reductase-like Zn-dependent oxidoreductase
MKALQFSEYGGPEVLRVAAAPDPHAGPGQVRVRVKAASVNAIDSKILTGKLAQNSSLDGPRYLGYDAAGVVDEVGEGVTDVAVGDDVFGLGSGTQAELAVLGSFARKPSSIDWSVAAAAGVAAETSIRALDLVGVGSGTTLLIDGGAGGVGAAAVQIAQARGATVIASASEGNQDYLREIGAIPVVYGPGLAERVRELAPQGLDAVFDVVGKTDITELVGLVDKPSQVVTIANFATGDAGVQVTTAVEDGNAALAETARLLERNDLVIKFQTFPLERAAEAYAISIGGHLRGKLVLLP